MRHEISQDRPLRAEKPPLNDCSWRVCAGNKCSCAERLVFFLSFFQIVFFFFLFPPEGIETL